MYIDYRRYKTFKQSKNTHEYSSAYSVLYCPVIAPSLRTTEPKHQ